MTTAPLDRLPDGAKRHPWNEDFEWTAPGAPFRCIDADQATAWSEDGFFLLEDAFSLDEMAAVTADLDGLDRQVTDFLKTQPDGKMMIAEDGNITFMAHAVVQSAAARAFCGHPVFQDLVHDLIGPDVRLYWDQGVFKKPEKPGTFPWHQDNGYTYVEPQQYVTCWVALTDATAANGCPWVVPGLHRHGTLEHWISPAGFQCLEDPEGAVPVEARAGSVVVFSSLTPHATGPNTTDSIRKAYIVQFAPDGASVRGGQPGRAAETELAADPQRQFPILAGGEAVAPPA